MYSFLMIALRSKKSHWKARQVSILRRLPQRFKPDLPSGC
jgi:hypothetical protein